MSVMQKMRKIIRLKSDPDHSSLSVLSIYWKIKKYAPSKVEPFIFFTQLSKTQ